MSLVVAAAALATACAQHSDSSPADATPAGAAVTGTIVVSAATSLTAAFERLATEFTAANPGTVVDLNVDGSSSLATQLLEGAPVDVFASADVPNMDRVVDAGLLTGTPRAFATNELVVITQPSNPAGIRSLADLDDLGDTAVVALCGADVPCGRYAAEVLARAGVTLDESRVTRGPNVGATLAAVAGGDAVAGIVYVTDALAAGDAVATVAIPTGDNVVATYPIGVASTGGNRRAAQAFVDWVLGAAGQRALSAFGFGPPP